MMNALAGMMLIAAAAVGGPGMPALSEAQRAQLETATDRTSRLDEGALYALLENVRTWEAGDYRGAEWPDYEAIRAEPAAARGELYLIEGTFEGVTPRYRLSRPGPWGEALTGWGVGVGPEPPAAIVYFVDPDGQLTEQPPRPGAEVRLVGRFYKVWTDRDRSGEQWEYLTFIARSAEATRSGGRADTALPGGPTLFVMVLLLVAGLVFVLWRLRKMTGRAIAPRRLRRSASASDLEAMEETAADETLPDDPEQALAELERRRREDTSN
ncbi:MAG: hypothetical protein WDZ31_03095 [Phycisphaeraceae bacterium]